MEQQTKLYQYYKQQQKLQQKDEACGHTASFCGGSSQSNKFQLCYVPTTSVLADYLTKSVNKAISKRGLNALVVWWLEVREWGCERIGQKEQRSTCDTSSQNPRQGFSSKENP
ncbi:hypothetical protein O181_006011 [Austropuccinia psidii MF-1]|uniref:Uncharacterized protein n=1 Tax=Austropuccinia psidii MF-1 TaxID=1389203 RepID=A0A9Q3BK01_9BASI|nr:hypothetical protein [Austropuccinia psidii MF-1]